eukprot:TRINITY_DN3622_c0_g1_i1.p1 TRINITY_DN3622_c0_g1~~TRINITY_DN3622_c0_g1_i1.p1  ORF type:complete len:546 (+),score=103.47 TRINITY_DN3622_c0_g1_i1:145-1782(+)
MAVSSLSIVTTSETFSFKCEDPLRHHSTRHIHFSYRKRTVSFQILPRLHGAQAPRIDSSKFKCFCNKKENPDEKGYEASVSGASESQDDNDARKSKSSTGSRNSKASDSPQLESAERSFEVNAIKLMELLGPEKIDPTDVNLIKEKLFGYTTFWVTEQEPFGDLDEGILFLGNLRGKREEVFAKLQRQLQEVAGTKYNLFMVEDPNSEYPDPNGNPRVGFGLLRKEASQSGPTTLWQYVIAIILFFLTAGSCLELAIACQLPRVPPQVVQYFTNPEANEPPDLQVLFPYLESSLPLAYGVLGVQLFHEVGHYLAALPKKVKLGIPYFIPNITLGSFGAITQFKSVLPDRKTKLDVSVAGPLAGGALSFVMFFVGLLLSAIPEVKGDLIEVPSTLFQGSFLLGLMSRAALGYDTMHAGSVLIHPLVIAGWCGLTTTAFNMLPVGSLDGGRAIQAAFGRRALQRFGLATYALLGLGKLGGPLSLPWGLYIVICQNSAEKPCLNDVSDVGPLRKNAITIAIFLVVLILLPLWDDLAGELGVGIISSSL